jgi:hypothetical protein
LRGNVLDFSKYCERIRLLIWDCFNEAVSEIKNEFFENSKYNNILEMILNKKSIDDLIFLFLLGFDNYEIFENTELKHSYFKLEIILSLKTVLFIYLKQLFNIETEKVNRSKMFIQVSSRRERIYIIALRQCSVNNYVIKIHGCNHEFEESYPKLQLMCPNLYKLSTSVKIKNDKATLPQFDLSLIRRESNKIIDKLIIGDSPEIRLEKNKLVDNFISGFFCKVEYYNSNLQEKIIINLSSILPELYDFFCIILLDRQEKQNAI